MRKGIWKDLSQNDEDHTDADPSTPGPLEVTELETPCNKIRIPDATLIYLAGGRCSNRRDEDGSDWEDAKSVQSSNSPRVCDDVIGSSFGSCIVSDSETSDAFKDREPVKVRSKIAAPESSKDNRKLGIFLQNLRQGADFRQNMKNYFADNLHLVHTKRENTHASKHIPNSTAMEFAQAFKLKYGDTIFTNRFAVPSSGSLGRHDLSGNVSQSMLMGTCLFEPSMRDPNYGIKRMSSPKNRPTQFYNRTELINHISSGNGYSVAPNTINFDDYCDNSGVEGYRNANPFYAHKNCGLRYSECDNILMSSKFKRNMACGHSTPYKHLPYNLNLSKSIPGAFSDNFDNSDDKSNFINKYGFCDDINTEERYHGSTPCCLTSRDFPYGTATYKRTGNDYEEKQFHSDMELHPEENRSSFTTSKNESMKFYTLDDAFEYIAKISNSLKARKAVAAETFIPEDKVTTNLVFSAHKRQIDQLDTTIFVKPADSNQATESRRDILDQFAVSMTKNSVSTPYFSSEANKTLDLTDDDSVVKVYSNFRNDHKEIHRGLGAQKTVQKDNDITVDNRKADKIVPSFMVNSVDDFGLYNSPCFPVEVCSLNEKFHENKPDETLNSSKYEQHKIFDMKTLVTDLEEDYDAKNVFGDLPTKSDHYNAEPESGYCLTQNGRKDLWSMDFRSDLDSSCPDEKTEEQDRKHPFIAVNGIYEKSAFSKLGHKSRFTSEVTKFNSDYNLNGTTISTNCDLLDSNNGDAHLESDTDAILKNIRPTYDRTDDTVLRILEDNYAPISRSDKSNGVNVCFHGSSSSSEIANGFSFGTSDGYDSIGMTVCDNLIESSALKQKIASCNISNYIFMDEYTQSSSAKNKYRKFEKNNVTLRRSSSMRNNFTSFSRKKQNISNLRDVELDNFTESFGEMPMGSPTCERHLGSLAPLSTSSMSEFENEVKPLDQCLCDCGCHSHDAKQGISKIAPTEGDFYPHRLSETNENTFKMKNRTVGDNDIRKTIKVIKHCLERLGSMLITRREMSSEQYCMSTSDAKSVRTTESGYVKAEGGIQQHSHFSATCDRKDSAKINEEWDTNENKPSKDIVEVPSIISKEEMNVRVPGGVTPSEFMQGYRAASVIKRLLHVKSMEAIIPAFTAFLRNR